MDALGQSGCWPHPIEIGVGLYHVQMSVHSARGILILIAQTHVRDGLPVTFQGFNVAYVSLVKGVFFKAGIQADGRFEHRFIPRGSYILAQSIDHKTNGIGLLLCISHTSVSI